MACIIAGLLACGLGACGSADSGILLEVTDQDLQPDRLQFVIGAEITTSQGTFFVSDPTSSVAATVTGRNLATEPYRLLIHDGLTDGSPLLGVVLAFAGTDLIGFAALDDTFFIKDKLLIYQVTLGDTDGVEILPTGCVRWNAGGQPRSLAPATDHDCDGYVAQSAGGDDCNDEDPNVNPGVTEVCGNGIDDNCNGETDESPDNDGDGYHLCDGDCDDNDPDVHPGAVEVCDGKDNDCNGICDDGFDADGDGYTTCGTIINDDGTCSTAPAPDCNDADATIHPGAPEICDGKDNDCNGICDDGGLDRDGDGFTTCGTLAGLPAPVPGGTCGAKAPALVDCRDFGTSGKTAHPFAHEFCDGIDDNCDGHGETSEPCWGSLPEIDCALGVRTCDDDRSDGSSGLTGSCVVGATPIQVDHALCDAYGGTCGSMAEPYRCASEMAAAAILDCTVRYTRALGSATLPPSATVCPGHAVAVPDVGVGGTCATTLVGGVTQESYLAGLRMAGTAGPPIAVYPGCDAELAITGATNTFLPQPDEWVVVVSDATQPDQAKVVVVTLTPQLTTTCPASPMSCTMRVP